MSAMQRNKGKAGEREVAVIVRDLTGWDVRRRVRQHDGDSDLQGVPGWSVEVKRHAKATRADIRNWWEQAARQADKEKMRPVLFFRANRDDWRAVWMPAPVCLDGVSMTWAAYEWTHETSVDVWAGEARESVK